MQIFTGRSPAQEALSGLQYVVELRVSPTPIDPHSVPSLDIFDVYHLYGEIGRENGRVRHALQLGYFKQSDTATSVANYLAAYFDAPRVVLTVPSRSLHLKFVPLKDIGATGSHSVIELAGERPIPPPAASPLPAPSPAKGRLPAQDRAPNPAVVADRKATSPSLLARILDLHR
ncbi:MAG: hypothetical protein ABSC32_10635 [Steroidobacteraceae bacterium]